MQETDKQTQELEKQMKEIEDAIHLLENHVLKAMRDKLNIGRNQSLYSC